MAIIYDPTHPYQPGPAPSPGSWAPGGITPPGGQPNVNRPAPHQLGVGTQRFQNMRGGFGSYSRFGMNQNFYNQFGGGQSGAQSNPYPGVNQFQGAGGGWPFQWQSQPPNFWNPGGSIHTSV